MTSAEHVGVAHVVADTHDPIAVAVRLRGGFEPIDGRYHWWGRIQHSPALSAAHRSGDHVLIRVGDHTSPARLSDVDPWGRFRVAGTGPPPFRRPATPPGDSTLTTADVSVFGTYTPYRP